MFRGPLKEKLLSKYSTSLQTIFRPQIQPWHPSSTLVHEAALAVQQVNSKAFLPFSALLFQNQKEYFDANVVNETRNATYKRLAKLAGQVEGVDEGKVFALLAISDKPDADGGLNGGNKVTVDVKAQVSLSCPHSSFSCLNPLGEKLDWNRERGIAHADNDVVVGTREPHSRRACYSDSTLRWNREGRDQ
jgi:hypothetical protein